MIDEITLNATTAATAASLANQEVPINFALPAGYRLFVTLGITVAAGFDVTAIGVGGGNGGAGGIGSGGGGSGAIDGGTGRVGGRGGDGIVIITCV